MKVSIVGAAGFVGSMTAYALALQDGADELVLVDVQENLTRVAAMDLESLRTTGRAVSVRAGTMEDIVSSDVVVMAANAPRDSHPRDRVQVFPLNLRMLEGELPVLRRLQGVLLVATNPVDPVCLWLHQQTGIDRRRIIGYNLNDTSRARVALARHLGIHPGRIELWVLGAHAMHEVKLFSRVRIDGKPVALSEADRRAVLEAAESFYARWQSLKTGRSTGWSTGEGLARMVRAVKEGSQDIFPCSVVLQGEYGLRDTSVAVPVRLGPGGVEEILQWELSPEEQRELAKAGALVQETLANTVRDLTGAGGPSTAAL